MSRKMISWLLKLVVLFVFAVFVAMGAWLLPNYMAYVRTALKVPQQVATFSTVYINLSFLPVYISLVLAFKVFATIAEDNSFCRANAKRFHLAMVMALTDVAMIVAFMAWAYSLEGHLVSPFMMLSALCLILVGLSAAIVCFALSKLVLQAVLLKEEADLTV